MLAALLALATQSQDVRVTTLTELRGALESARPGQRIVIAPGAYPGNVSASGLSGTAERPIVVAGETAADRPRIAGVHFSRVAHIVLRDVVIDGATGNGVNIDDGGTVSQPSHHVTVANVHVTRTPSGNIDGIKLSGIDDFVVKDSTIENWGGSAIDMVGCHRGVVESCTFRNGGDNGVQCKGGTSEVVVRRSWFENAGQRSVNLGGSTGMQFFRPSGAKYEARGLTVEGCTFVGSVAPIAFVGVDGATVRFNTIYVPDKWAFRILQETVAPGFPPCRNGVFTDNIVAFRSDKWSSGGANVGPNTAPETFRFERNWWYCIDRPTQSSPQLPTKEQNGTYGIDPQFVEPGKLGRTSPAARFGASAFKG